MKKRGRFLGFILYSMLLFLTGLLCTAKKAGSVILEKQHNVEKFQKLFSVLEIWVEKKQQGKNIEDFLKRNEYYSVAVYGLGNVGKLLEEELKDYAELRYGIDRRTVSTEFPVYRPEDDLPEVDVVIVTPAYEFEEIEEALKKKLSCPVYSIEDIVYFMD